MTFPTMAALGLATLGWSVGRVHISLNTRHEDPRPAPRPSYITVRAHRAGRSSEHPVPCHQRSFDRWFTAQWLPKGKAFSCRLVISLDHIAGLPFQVDDAAWSVHVSHIRFKPLQHLINMSIQMIRVTLS
ncbi:hypothetical protein H257_12377 [Aphanomyces astaci]|uniref:Uncharacterized protein n=1 Tax=Aphanomyces astaci TaxID=112090 RepID=W4FYT8_APHAT|nr:hypothetical protein H257_12377 [Aphanomyces astaci]ETV72627.1 hypothetical protein H257_12377 [Aphanomyces astaci]|eukprot:XP_009837855.1 hypothetical protein H257_12377 [Aphanomyces astaci]